MQFAIKLIRKEAVGYSASRLNKVEREIHALKVTALFLISVLAQTRQTKLFYRRSNIRTL